MLGESSLILFVGLLPIGDFFFFFLMNLDLLDLEPVESLLDFDNVGTADNVDSPELKVFTVYLEFTVAVSSPPVVVDISSDIEPIAVDAVPDIDIPPEPCM